jgi:hypothetical protein
MTTNRPIRKQSDDDHAAETAAVEKAVRESAREAVLMHKRAGYPAVGWKGGRVVWVPPDQIEVNDDQNGVREIS